MTLDRELQWNLFQEKQTGLSDVGGLLWRRLNPFHLLPPAEHLLNKVIHKLSEVRMVKMEITMIMSPSDGDIDDDGDGHLWA